MWKVFFTVFFLVVICSIIKYRFNLKKAAELSVTALYPNDTNTHLRILVPVEWKEMEPLSKDTKSYKIVNWVTIFAALLLMILLGIVIATDWLDSSFLSTAYGIFVLIRFVKHQGNMYILPNGIILNSRFFSFRQLKGFEVEKIVRWHELYGLDDRLNNAYKLTFLFKKRLLVSNYFVVQDHLHLETVADMLKALGLKELKNTERVAPVPAKKVEKS